MTQRPEDDGKGLRDLEARQQRALQEVEIVVGDEPEQIAPVGVFGRRNAFVIVDRERPALTKGKTERSLERLTSSYVTLIFNSFVGG
jgi:hypothetical protein